MSNTSNIPISSSICTCSAPSQGKSNANMAELPHNSNDNIIAKLLNMVNTYNKKTINELERNKNLKQELQKMRQQNNSLRKAFKDHERSMRKEASIMRREASKMRREASKMRKEASEMKKEASQVKEEASQVKEKASKMRREASKMREETSQVKKEVSQLRNNLLNTTSDPKSDGQTRARETRSLFVTALFKSEWVAGENDDLPQCTSTVWRST